MMMVSGMGMTGRRYRAEALQRPLSRLPARPGTKPIKSQWVYVRLDGLYLGNYRMMLSIGGAPSDGINTAGNHKFYAN